MAQTTKKAAKAPATRNRAPARKTAKAPATRPLVPAKKPANAPPIRPPVTARKSTTSQRAVTQRRATVDRTAEMFTEVLKAVEDGQRAAIAAVPRFVDTADEVIPALGDRPSRREQVIDSVVHMADKLVTTQCEFLRSVVRSADRSLGTPPK